MSASGGRSTETAIHQLLPAVPAHDEVARHAVALRRALRAGGWRTELFVEGDPTRPDAVDGGFAVTDFPRVAQRRDCLIVHHLDDLPTASALLPRCEQLVVDYHGPRRRLEHESGRRGPPAGLTPLARLTRRAVCGLAHSPPGRTALEAAGCRTIAQVPLLVSELDMGPDSSGTEEGAGFRVRRRLEVSAVPGAPEWLHVGPLSATSAQDDMIKALWVYRRLYGPARLHLVGPEADRLYLRALRDLVRSLGLTKEVRLVGELSPAQLAAYLEVAQAYLSLRPDGVVDAGVRLAFAHRVPVLTRMAATWPEIPPVLAVAGAGPAKLAASLHRLGTDRALGERLSEQASSWLEGHGLDDEASRITGVLAAVVDPELSPAGEARA